MVPRSDREESGTNEIAVTSINGGEAEVTGGLNDEEAEDDVTHNDEGGGSGLEAGRSFPEDYIPFNWVSTDAPSVSGPQSNVGRLPSSSSGSQSNDAASGSTTESPLLSDSPSTFPVKNSFTLKRQIFTTTPSPSSEQGLRRLAGFLDLVRDFTSRLSNPTHNLKQKPVNSSITATVESREPIKAPEKPTSFGTERPTTVGSNNPSSTTTTSRSAVGDGGSDVATTVCHSCDLAIAFSQTTSELPVQDEQDEVVHQDEVVLVPGDSGYDWQFRTKFDGPIVTWRPTFGEEGEHQSDEENDGIGIEIEDEDNGTISFAQTGEADGGD